MGRSLLIAILVMISGELCAESGYDFVARRSPELHLAAVQALGETQARSLFQDWTEIECKEAEAAYGPMLDRLVRMANDTQRPVEKLNGYKSTLKAFVAEVYGNANFRQRAKASGRLYMTEVEFHELRNPGGGPDGLIYSIDGNRLILHELMEAKSAMHFSPVQVKNQIGAWAHKGLSARNEKGEIVTFKPENILLGDGKSSIPIARAKPEDVRARMTLVGVMGDRPPAPTDSVLPLPMKYDQLNGIANRLALNRLEPEYIKLAERELLVTGRWPQRIASAFPTPMDLYKRLSPAVREFCSNSSERMPASGVMMRYLMEAPCTLENQEVFADYVKVYGLQPLPQGTTVLEYMVMRKDRNEGIAWARYFASHPGALSHPRPTVLGFFKCAAYYRELALRRQMINGENGAGR